MGCDIHLKVEVRKDGQWRIADPFLPCYSCGPKGWNHRESCWRCGGKGAVNGYRHRNYFVFAKLADVRNSHGIVPISEPRGLPGDSPAAARHAAAMENDEDEGPCLGDHSFSWLTLREIQGADWDGKITVRAFVALNEWRRAKADGRTPDSWAGGVSGTILTEAEAPSYLTSAGEWVHVDATWQIPLREYAKDFLGFVDAMAKLGPPDDVRIVFGFDS